MRDNHKWSHTTQPVGLTVLPARARQPSINITHPPATSHIIQHPPLSRNTRATTTLRETQHSNRQIIIKWLLDGGYDYIWLASMHHIRCGLTQIIPNNPRPLRDKTRQKVQDRHGFSMGSPVMSQLPPDTHDVPRDLSVSNPFSSRLTSRSLHGPRTPETHELAHATHTLPPTKPTKHSVIKLTIRHVQTDAVSHRTPFATKRRSNKPTSDLTPTPTIAGVQQTHNTTISPSTTTATSCTRERPPSTGNPPRDPQARPHPFRKPRAPPRQPPLHQASQQRRPARAPSAFRSDRLMSRGPCFADSSRLQQQHPPVRHLRDPVITAHGGRSTPIMRGPDRSDHTITTTKRSTAHINQPTYPQQPTVLTDSSPHAQRTPQPHIRTTTTPRKQVPDNKSRTFRTLRLFSGRADRHDGLVADFEIMGWECDDIDIVNSSLLGKQHSDRDLLDDELWLSINKWFRGRVCDFVWLGAPCATFSVARWQIIPDSPNAPRPLPEKLPMGL
jgi:hypothetical protein